jgi:hypothetical protein
MRAFFCGFGARATTPECGVRGQAARRQAWSRLSDEVVDAADGDNCEADGEYSDSGGDSGGDGPDDNDAGGSGIVLYFADFFYVGGDSPDDEVAEAVAKNEQDGGDDGTEVGGEGDRDQGRRQSGHFSACFLRFLGRFGWRFLLRIFRPPLVLIRARKPDFRLLLTLLQRLFSI